MPDKKRKITFILNPKAGKGGALKLLSYLLNKRNNSFQPHVRIWEHADEIDALMQSVKEEEPDAIVAVGGDGTVNQIASRLIGSDIALGIVPCGSGNGLARELDIPLNTKKAIDLIEAFPLRKIDAASIDGHYFFCTAGLGLDASIAHRFATSGKRGFITYVKLTLKEVFVYKPKHFLLKSDCGEQNADALLLTFANAKQFGNDAFIAPEAKIDDGQLHAVWIPKIPLHSIPRLLIQLLSSTLNRNKYYHQCAASAFTVMRNEEGPMHFDGEPGWTGKAVEVKCEKQVLQVIAPGKRVP